MWDWVRRIPTFNYGKCGGAKRDCSKSKPRDWLDLAFEEHDEDLYLAEKEVKKSLRKIIQKSADRKLAKVLRKGDSIKLKLWGKIYRWMAMIIFNP